MLGKPRPLPTRLYAVAINAAASPTPGLPRPRINLEELKRQKESELRAKKAIDRANALLDRIAARLAEYDFQIEAFERGKKILKTRAVGIEDEILSRMAAARLDRADGFDHYFVAKPSPAALDVYDETLVPDEYMRETITTAPDKIAIKAVLAKAAAKTANERDRALAAAIGGVRLVQKIRLVRK